MRVPTLGTCVVCAAILLFAETLDAATSCEQLKSLALPNTTITAAEVVAAAGFTPPAATAPAPQPYRDLPAFCRVAASLTPTSDSDIKVEVWLPTSGWNGKFLAVGNGGFAGSINYRSMADSLHRGYATTSTDTGHTGGGGRFALGHPEKLIDYAYRSEHEMAVTAKALIAAFYGTAATRSYWNGCSGGGRQGLKEAQRFPGDFDGIIAGAPAINWTGRAVQALWLHRAVHKSNASYVPSSKFPLIHEAVLQACDAVDGVKDGVLEDPTRCRFDPKVLTCAGPDSPSCLTAAQVETVQTIYAPVTNPRTGQVIFPGHERGSELGWSTMAGAQPFATGPDHFKYVVFQDPNWDQRSFDLARDAERADQIDRGAINALDPDLTAFYARGGKLIQYHGWSDPQISPGSSVLYYRSVLDRMGGLDAVRHSHRLFMVPGMAHCGGGEGTSRFDMLAALEQWVEKGVAPEQIVASRVRQGQVERTRPLCPYPQVATYSGTGSTDEAASFICRAPTQTLEASGGQSAPPQLPTERPPTRADVLRGDYGRYRANNDLLFYDLDVRVDPEKKHISGKNTIRFRMLQDDTRIQLDLYANLTVDKILFGQAPLTYEREINAVFVNFPETLKAGREYAVEFHYSGTPLETGRFGGFSFGKDPSGHHWITTACEGQGASIWWPNKDQWRDEPEGMTLSVAIPSTLVDVSNGTFVGKTDLGDGYTRWDWRVHYPINSYNVSLNIGNYVHFSDRLGDLPLDYFVLPGNLEKAKRQFAQAQPMLVAFEKYFGAYPFAKDGYKLIEVPYSGMEHQSAVTYGNRFANGYLERDWTGVGVSLKFDFIIIHESGHEWFGNAISAADVSDMWIHEGWTTYLETLYVEQVFGYDDALKYVNGYKPKVRNREPIITQRGIHRTPNQDQYFKGALFLHTLRSVVNDDTRWWKLLQGVFDRFKYRNIMTEDIVRFFNAELGQNLTPLFDQYLRRAALPVLELAFNEKEGTVAYRWKADERGFAMPIRVGSRGAWQIIEPTPDWKTMHTTLTKETFDVATDLYYVDVAK